MTWWMRAALAVAVLFLAWLARRWIRKIDTKADDTTDLGLQRLATALLYCFTGWVLLALAGVPISALGSVLAGAAAGLAIASRDFIANILGAVSIYTDRPFSLRDTIRTGKWEGRVTDIGMRSVTIETADGPVRIPNKVFLTDPIQVIATEEEKNGAADDT